MRIAGAVIGVVLWALAPLAAVAQESGPDVGKYLTMIDNGQAEQVRNELPALMTKYPNNPGVLFIQGRLTKDGAEAVRIYQSIVDNFPKSEWADDALNKVYQFYYALGLYRTAEMKLAQLKRDYPASKYVTRSTEVNTKGFAEEKEQPSAPAGDTTVPAQQADIPPSPDRPAADVAVKPGGTVPERSTDQFALQVGAYSSEVNAEKQKVFFESLQFPVEVNTKVKSGRSLYIVRIGNFASYDDAKAKGEEIKKKYNIDSIVVTK